VERVATAFGLLAAVGLVSGVTPHVSPRARPAAALRAL
jgi:hypothetical protein